MGCGWNTASFGATAMSPSSNCRTSLPASLPSRVLVFCNRLTAGEFDDAIALGRATAAPPDVASVRRAGFRTGFGVSTQVEIS
jgi:hypothetical protein